MREVDTESYLGVLKELVQEGRTVSLLISGSSMSPFLIHHRDYIYFKAPDRPLKRGDMVFYNRDSGQYVMHRIRKVHWDESGSLYDMIGDGQRITEKGIREDQIFGLIIRVKRNGKDIQPGDFWWEFFRTFWLSVIPIRRPVSILYEKCAGLFRKRSEQPRE
ncbi:MAG: S24/S26 family peptidase [Lachnospiraceae bacterium]|nr:S24/S26 family peptidase [Lachnospiraceae bacterium]